MFKLKANQIRLIPINHLICDNAFNGNKSQSIRHVTKTVNKAELHEDIDEKLRQGLHPRKQPGRRYMPSVHLPVILEHACYKVIKKYKRKSFRDDVYRINNQFHHRQLPVEAAMIQEKYKELEYRYVEKENFVLNQIDPMDRDEALRNREKKIQQALQREIYNWQPFEYDEYNSITYMAARLPPNFAAIKHVFHEIKCGYPDFKPKTLFDFGSGVGTTIWAANEIWPNSFSEHFCVDISQEAHDIARLLLKQGENRAPLVYEGIFTRQFLPVSSNIKYDLVVSAFSLLELPSLQSRIHTIENLWHKTEDLLVIIEHGKKPGFNAVLEARNLILQITGHKVTETYNVDSSFDQVTQLNDDTIPTSHIMAPCPHNYPCPKLFTGQIQPCNFSVSFNHLDISDLRKILWDNKEEFSYCIIQKKPLRQKDNPPWPRVLGPIMKQKGTASCKLCCPDGTLKKIRVTKRNDSKNLYQIVKLSKWSDLLPITIHQVEKTIRNTTDEINDDEIVSDDIISDSSQEVEEEKVEESQSTDEEDNNNETHDSKEQR